MGENTGDDSRDGAPDDAAPDDAAPDDAAPDDAAPGDAGSETEGKSADVLQAALEHEARALYLESLTTTVRGLELVEARMHALRARAVAALHSEMRRVARDPAEAGEALSLTAAEVAAALNVSQRTGRALVEEAVALAEPGLAPVLEALEEGRLDRRRARVVMEHACILPPGKDAEFSAAAVELACPEDEHRAPSPGALSRRLRRLAEDYHPDPLAERKERAVAFRKVEIEPSKDGMCWISAHLPVEVGASIDTRLEALARSLQGPRERRGISQLRADVFRDLLLDGQISSAPSRMTTSGATCPASAASSASSVGATGATGARDAGSLAGAAGAGGIAGASSLAGAGGAPSVGGGVRMEVVVTVPARTLTGESETPAEILGYGPLDAPAARLLAAEAATWTTMYVDPGTGAPLALGRRRYTPSLAIRRFLGARDRTCRFPGCDRPAPAIEADHTTEWQHGGQTEVGNLALLCREHHRLKTLGFWKVRQVEAGQKVSEEPEPTRASTTRASTTRASTAEAGAAGAGTAQAGTASPEQAPPQQAGAEQVGPEQVGPEQVPAQIWRGSQAEATPGGVLEWTSPMGRRYMTYPEQDAPPPF